MKYLRITLILLVCFLQITNSKGLKRSEPSSNYKADLYKHFINQLNPDITCNEKKLTADAFKKIVDLAAKLEQDSNNIFEITKIINSDGSNPCKDDNKKQLRKKVLKAIDYWS